MSGKITGFDENMNEVEVIPKQKVKKNLNAIGWYRVAELDNNPDNRVGNYGGAFLVNIYLMYNNSNNMSAMLGVNLTYNKAKITNLSTSINTKVITQVRVTHENGKVFLEIYYNSNTSNTVNVEIIQQSEQCTMLDFESPTDTETVLTTLAINESGITQLTDRNEIFTDKTGFSVLDGNMFKDRNRYFGNITVKKDSGNFNSTADVVLGFAKKIKNYANIGCFIGNGQWNVNDVGGCYIDPNGIQISDKNNQNKYNTARIIFDVIVTD